VPSLNYSRLHPKTFANRTASRQLPGHRPITTARGRISTHARTRTIDVAEDRATITTPLGDEPQLGHVTGHDGLDELFAYEVELISDDPNIDEAELLCKPATITLSLPEDKALFPRHRRGLRLREHARSLRHVPRDFAPVVVVAVPGQRLPHLPALDRSGPGVAGVPRPRLQRLQAHATASARSAITSCSTARPRSASCNACWSRKASASSTKSRT